jgi:two-component system, NtrC family, response regulator HydG
MSWCLVVQLGLDKQVISLNPGIRVTLGRHRSNTVVLADEHCSRRHAEVYDENGSWHIRDLKSQNGTYVDGKRVQSCPLVDGQILWVGQARLRFCRMAAGEGGDKPPQKDPTPSPESVATLLIRSTFAADQLSALCQFMADAVDEANVMEMVRLALETLQIQIHANVVGFLGMHEGGEILPKLILPASSQMDMPLSQRLTAEISKSRRGVWLAKEREANLPATASLAPFQDVIGVPVIAQETLIGVLHAYRQKGAFALPDMQFCEVVSHFLAARLRLARLSQQLELENERLRRRAGVEKHLLGDSPAMVRLRQTIERVAPLPSTVLIRGESGVGKELVAQALHERSRRAEAPFVVMNCAAIPVQLLESQLFGHKKGAFTDAKADQEGFFSRADGGTLFLDEVGELPMECQAKLLRVLEGHSFTPLGETDETYVDVRFLAATNRDLEKEVREGRFRSDLYYRLNVVEIPVPSLREHAADIPLLAERFLDRLRVEYGRKVRLAPEALEYMAKYSWPGNVRQLRHMLESATALAEADVINVADLRLDGKDSAATLPSLKIEELERLAVIEALRRTGNQVTEAAQLLGMARSTVYQKAKQFGIIT